MISVMRAVAHSRPRRADVRLAPTRRGSAATIVRMLSAGESHVVTSAAHPRVSRYQRRATQRAHRPSERWMTTGTHMPEGLLDAQSRRCRRR
jgi:hypothetical protein